MREAYKLPALESLREPNGDTDDPIITKLSHWRASQPARQSNYWLTGQQANQPDRQLIYQPPENQFSDENVNKLNGNCWLSGQATGWLAEQRSKLELNYRTPWLTGQQANQPDRHLTSHLKINSQMRTLINQMAT